MQIAFNAGMSSIRQLLPAFELLDYGLFIYRRHWLPFVIVTGMVLIAPVLIFRALWELVQVELGNSLEPLGYLLVLIGGFICLRYGIGVVARMTGQVVYYGSPHPARALRTRVLGIGDVWWSFWLLTLASPSVFLLFGRMLELAFEGYAANGLFVPVGWRLQERLGLIGAGIVWCTLTILMVWTTHATAFNDTLYQWSRQQKPHLSSRVELIGMLVIGTAWMFLITAYNWLLVLLRIGIGFVFSLPVIVAPDRVTMVLVLGLWLVLVPLLMIWTTVLYLPPKAHIVATALEQRIQTWSEAATS